MTHDLSLRQLFFILTIAFCGLFAASALYSWTGPTQAPPSGNVSAPINVGTTAQVKNGGLSVNAFSAFGNAYIQGNLGVGVVSPTQVLDVNGPIKIGGGSASCSSLFEGSVRYETTYNNLEICDGVAWAPAGSLSQGISGEFLIHETNCSNSKKDQYFITFTDGLATSYRIATRVSCGTGGGFDGGGGTGRNP